MKLNESKIYDYIMRNIHLNGTMLYNVTDVICHFVFVSLKSNSLGETIHRQAVKLRDSTREVHYKFYKILLLLTFSQVWLTDL